jgi:two-component system, NarL family, sensor histidine kinase EvgS
VFGRGTVVMRWPWQGLGALSCTLVLTAAALAATTDSLSLEHERIVQRWLPAMVVAALSLLGLLAATLWWNRRLARESAQHQRALEVIDDIGRALPGCTYRYVFDSQQRVVHTYLSSGAERFMGVRLQPGQTLHAAGAQHMDEAPRRALMRALREAEANGQRFAHIFPYNHPDGRKLWMHSEAVGGKTASGETTWTGQVIDVTERQQLLQQVERETDERYLLLATASHELRAPAHTLLLALQTMADGERAAAPGSPQVIARDAAKTLVQLLDEVLDMARTRYGRIELRPQHFNLHALFEQVADSQAGLIADKGLRFTRQIGAGVPRTVCADPLRLKQVLTNVLNNAAKYTEQGSIEFSLRADSPGGDGTLLQFVVADSGVGIAEEMREQLFQPFSATFAGAMRPDLRTTGLGLANCRRLLDLMQGTLDIHSVPQQGTRVHIGLPLGALASSAAPLRSPGAILVCDDDTVGAALLAEMLRKDGHEVVLVDSAIDALARWRRGGVSVVISDLNMPAMGGAELMERIRAEEADGGARTALIICSGDPAPEPGARAPGFDAFICKPADMRVLSDTLAALGVALQAAVVTGES